MTVVRKAGIADVPLIRDMAATVWPITYSHILSPGQIRYMMELIYSTSSLQQQVARGHQFIVAYTDETPVAFASYSPKEQNPSIYKLHKIYIMPDRQGKGLGRLLINYVMDDIKPAACLQLNVNRHNQALHFYERLGFSIIAEEDIDIGNGFFMNDYVMEMKIR